MMRTIFMASAIMIGLGCATADAQQELPKSWGRCMYNGGVLNQLGSAQVDQWCRTTAQLKPGGNGTRGVCLFNAGRAGDNWDAAQKKCG